MNSFMNSLPIHRVMVGLGPVQYTAKDSAVVVDATGLVTAHFVTFQNARVVATVTDTVHHVTLRDTCFLQVTATAPSAPLAVFTLQSVSGDTLPLSQSNHTLNTIATDAAGNSFPTFAYFTSADASIAGIDKFTGNLFSRRTGQVLLYAEMWAYGVAKRDSLRVTIGVPSAVKISVLPVTPTGSTHSTLTFWPQTITVVTGAVVTWENLSYSDSIDVVFDDPAKVDSAQFTNIFLRFATGRGNITPWVWDTLGIDPIAARICARFGGSPPGPSCAASLQIFSQDKTRLRSFPVAGTYHYHSEKWGTSGTIIVQ